MSDARGEKRPGGAPEHTTRRRKRLRSARGERL